MKAIETKYLGPTNFKGSRVRAKDGDGHRVIITWRYELNSEPNHKAAAVALCEKMGWKGSESLVGGGLGDRMVWVFTPCGRSDSGVVYY